MSTETDQQDKAKETQEVKILDPEVVGAQIAEDLIKKLEEGNTYNLLETN